MNVLSFATREVVTIAPMDPIDRALSLMEEHGIHHLVVQNKGEVVGMLSDRDILVSTGWMLSVERQTDAAPSHPSTIIGPRVVAQIMSRPPVCITHEESSRGAAMLMLEHKISALPVMHWSRLVAIITDTDLMRWLSALSVSDATLDQYLRRPVEGLMRARVFTVTPEAPLPEVSDLFRRRRIRHVPVVSADRLMGIISDRDVRRALGWASVREIQGHDENRETPRIPRRAADIMMRDVVTVSPTSPLRDALGLLLKKRIHSLPVVDGVQLTGMVTETDFLKAIAREDLL